MTAHVLTRIAFLLAAMAIGLLYRGFRLHIRRVRLGRVLRRTGRRILAAHRRQVELHERFLRRQRPWQHDGMRWKGLRLIGSLLPAYEESRRESDDPSPLP